MALQAFWHEDFLGFPNGQVQNIPGIGWGAGGVSVIASALFPSGKTMDTNGSQARTPFTFQGIIPDPIFVTQWDQIRLGDNSNGNGGCVCGLAFSVGNEILVGFGQVPLQDAITLRTVVGGVTTVVFTSAPAYFLGVKVPIGVQFESATGTYRLYINGTLAFSGVVAGWIGLTPVGLTIGRFANGAAGSNLYGNFYGYTGQAYVGPIEIRSGFPISNDTLQQWTSVPAGGFSSIDNVYSTTPATVYIEEATPGEISDFNAPVNNAAVVSVLSMEHRYYATRTDVLAVNMRGRIHDTVTYVPGADVAPPQTAYQSFRDIYSLVNPITGVAWVPADMATIGLGYEKRT